jgi:hypothetical protein
VLEVLDAFRIVDRTFGDDLAGEQAVLEGIAARAGLAHGRAGPVDWAAWRRFASSLAAETVLLDIG